MKLEVGADGFSACNTVVFGCRSSASDGSIRWQSVYLFITLVVLAKVAGSSSAIGKASATPASVAHTA
jgi:hypothetical protein